jgi:hypothetical protein
MRQRELQFLRMHINAVQVAPCILCSQQVELCANYTCTTKDTWQLHTVLRSSLAAGFVLQARAGAA